MALKSLLGRSPATSAAEGLYDLAVAQAREPAFYTDCAVPDTLDGRFDMVALHVYLLLRALRRGGQPAAATGQALFDTMFDDMDRSLREIGVGDLSVGRRVKAMAQALYGRIAAYDKGLESEDDALADALLRNVYRNAAPAPAAVLALSNYVRREAAALALHPQDRLLKGEVAFGPAPGRD